MCRTFDTGNMVNMFLTIWIFTKNFVTISYNLAITILLIVMNISTQFTIFAITVFTLVLVNTRLTNIMNKVTRFTTSYTTETFLILFLLVCGCFIWSSTAFVALLIKIILVDSAVLILTINSIFISSYCTAIYLLYVIAVAKLASFLIFTLLFIFAR